MRARLFASRLPFNAWRGAEGEAPEVCRLHLPVCSTEGGNREIQDAQRNQTAETANPGRPCPSPTTSSRNSRGAKYTGVKIGRGHTWYYDKGEWKEKKVTPDEWQFTYDVPKRRAGKAPEGSGVPVGTEYHWYIAAHQNVRKLNANDYSTTMTGIKYKLAHKRADSDKWSASEKAQRKRLIAFLQELIDALQKEEDLPIPLTRPKATKRSPARKARKPRKLKRAA